MKAINDVLETQNLGNREQLQEVIRAFILTNCQNWYLARSLWNDMALREATSVMAMVINRRTGQLAAKLLELVKKVNEEDGTEQKDSRVMVALIFSYMTSVSRWYKGRGRLSAEQVADHSVRLISRGIFAPPSS
jgi:AcrR family transcriptional regulator